MEKFLQQQKIRSDALQIFFSHCLLEKLLEDVSFDAPELTEKHVVIDEAYVDAKLHDIVKNRDLSQFIL